MGLLWEGQERGRMYAAYALSALMTPQSPVDSLLAAGLVPALLSVLQTSRVRPGSVGAPAAWLEAGSLLPGNPFGRVARPGLACCTGTCMPYLACTCTSPSGRT